MALIPSGDTAHEQADPSGVGFFVFTDRHYQGSCESCVRGCCVRRYVRPTLWMGDVCIVHGTYAA